MSEVETFMAKYGFAIGVGVGMMFIGIVMPLVDNLIDKWFGRDKD